MAFKIRPEWQRFKKETDFEAVRTVKMDVGPLFDELYAKLVETQKRYEMVQKRSREIIGRVEQLGNAFIANADAMAKAPGADKAKQAAAARDYAKLRAAVRADLKTHLAPVPDKPESFDIHVLKA